jgi:broad specificity phosphatase PhoE
LRHPTVYYIRHGETDWNAESRLQGQRDTELNALGRRQAAQCGEILRDLIARDGRAAADFDYVSSPLIRARATMELSSGVLGLDPVAYRVDARLQEMSFGRWEGFTYSDVMKNDSETLAARERDKWRFAAPGGESYQQLTKRVGEWYATVERDSVVAAHGGTARALMVHLGVAPPESAPHGSIDQGVVYVFIGDRMTRYA